MTESVLPRFRVEYRVVVAKAKSGVSAGSNEELLQCTSTTNDLNVLFTDLFYEHRYNGLLGLEILSVNPIHASVGGLAITPKMLPSIH